MSSSKHTDELIKHDLMGKLAYQVGVVHEKLKAIRQDITMGVYKDAAIKTNDVIKYMESNMIPDSYLHGDIEVNDAPSMF